jgi:hypothetical protein
MSKVKIICDSSVGRSGVILHGHIGPTAAYDAGLGEFAPSTWRFLELKPGVQEVDLSPEDLKAWQSLARDAGLTIEARKVYIVSDKHAGADDGVRFPGYRPRVPAPTAPAAPTTTRNQVSVEFASTSSKLSKARRTIRASSALRLVPLTVI